MAAINFGNGPNTNSGDTVRQALVKLETRLDTVIAARDATIAALNATVAEKVNVIVDRDNTIAGLNLQVADLEQQIADLQSGSGGSYTPPVISLSAAQSAAEGNSGTQSFVFTVTRVGDLTKTSSALWALTGQLNAADLGDGQPTSGTINFAIGARTATITIVVKGDTTAESTEQSTLTISNPVRATLGTSSATLTITDDDSNINPPSGVPILTSLDTSIYPPGARLVSTSQYPPAIDLEPGFVPPTAENDWFRLIASNNRDLTSPLFTFDYQLTPANLGPEQQPPTVPVTGLANIVSPAQTYFGLMVIKPDGRYSPTLLLKHGDTVAPTITSGETASFVEMSPISDAWTAGENVKVTLTGTDAGLVESSFLEGTAGVFRLKANAEPDYSQRTTYSFTANFTDDGGNTTSVNKTWTITSLDRSPKAFAFVDVTDANPNQLYTSNGIKIEEVDPEVTLLVTMTGGGEYRKNTGDWLPAADTSGKLGDEFFRRGTTAGYGSNLALGLNIGGVQDTYNVLVKQDTSGVVIMSGPQPAGQNGNYSAGTITFSIETTALGDLFIQVPGSGGGRKAVSVSCNGTPMNVIVDDGTSEATTVWRLNNVSPGVKSIAVSYNAGVAESSLWWATVAGASASNPAYAAYGTYANQGGNYSGPDMAIPAQGAGIVFLYGGGGPAFTNSKIAQIGVNPEGYYLVGRVTESLTPTAMNVSNGSYLVFYTLIFTKA